MELITRIGKITVLFSIICVAYAQSPVNNLRCVASAVPTQVRMEGMTERLGDVLLQCSSSANANVTGNLALFLPVSITNRVDSDNNAVDATLLVNYGTGFVPAGIPGM